MKQKRAQGLPISTIIIAALGIMVLVVIGAIFGGQIGKFGRAASECQGRCYHASPPSDQASLYSTNPCDTSGSETKLSGSFVPRGLGKVDDITRYRCSECCIISG